MERPRTALERCRSLRGQEGRAACPRGRVRPSARDDASAGHRTRPRLRAGRIRRSGHDRRPQCALGHGRGRDAQAPCPCHADHARGGRKRLRPEGAGLEPHRDGRALARTLGGACQRAAGRTRHRRAHRPSQPGGAGHRAGAAKPDRRARAAHRGRRDRGRRPRGNAPRDRAQQRRTDHRRSLDGARRDHAPAIDLHAARHGDVRAPAQRRNRAVQRRDGRDARARPIWSNSARTDGARTASPPAR